MGLLIGRGKAKVPGSKPLTYLPVAVGLGYHWPSEGTVRRKAEKADLFHCLDPGALVRGTHAAA